MILSEVDRERVRQIIISQVDVSVQRAVSALVQIHLANNGERFERDAKGMPLIDRRCYGLARLKIVHPTSRAAAHFLLEEIGIKVDIDLENLPPCEGNKA